MRRRNAFVLLTAVFFLSGCMSQKQPTSKYYVIERPDSLQVSESLPPSSVEGYCEILPVDVYPAYASQSIAQRKESNEIVYYSYHHWAVRPGESMTLLLEDYLDQASVFDGVSTRYWKISPAFKLATTVYNLETLQEDGEMWVHLSVRFKLLNDPDNEVLITHHANRKEVLPQKDLNLYAKTVGELFHEALHHFSQKMVEQLSDNQ
jgi:ABC-type uncharacterized transport system auxiliary subunit